MDDTHEKFMDAALLEAGKAGQKGEIPVGAVLVSASGDILSRNHNQTVCLSDPSAHAEILVLREASQNILNYRLLNTILYVTVEPCVMCMGAIIHARILQVVFGAHDPKWGGAGSLYNFTTDARFNHHPRIVSGIRHKACRELIQNFFRLKRKGASCG